MKEKRRVEKKKEKEKENKEERKGRKGEKGEKREQEREMNFQWQRQMFHEGLYSHKPTSPSLPYQLDT